jgi:hypothetical protein
VRAGRHDLGRDGGEGSDGREVRLVKVGSRYVALLWLLAALSMVGWLIVNLDTAGWILIVLVVGLMAWQLTSRDRGGRGGGARSKSQRLPDEPAP